MKAADLVKSLTGKGWKASKGSVISKTGNVRVKLFASSCRLERARVAHYGMGNEVKASWEVISSGDYKDIRLSGRGLPIIGGHILPLM